MQDGPTDVVEPLIAETLRAVADMKKTKDLEQRRLQSEIVLNLCRSLGVFFEAMQGVVAADDIDDFDFFADDDDM